MPIPALTRSGSYTIDLGGILIVSKNTSECLHCGTNIVEPKKPCPYCNVLFRTLAITYTGNPFELREDSDFEDLTPLGYAIGGRGVWHITTECPS